MPLSALRRAPCGARVAHMNPQFGVLKRTRRRRRSCRHRARSAHRPERPQRLAAACSRSARDSASCRLESKEAPLPGDASRVSDEQVSRREVDYAFPGCDAGYVGSGRLAGRSTPESGAVHEVGRALHLAPGTAAVTIHDAKHAVPSTGVAKRDFFRRVQRGQPIRVDLQHRIRGQGRRWHWRIGRCEPDDAQGR